MVYIVPSLPETLADRALYIQSRLVELPCQGCQARVKVRKNSDHQTSIQWTRAAVADCATFASLARQAGGRPVHAGCAQLSASIEEAVRDGALAVGLPDE
ncbi:hypothetical protein [Aeromicrobium sp.]|uniref:hypothetical protein n=1 Tax=Aeromicrobium sp. TaxID=1871063 RepID=UPI0030BC5B9D